MSNYLRLFISILLLFAVAGLFGQEGQDSLLIKKNTSVVYKDTTIVFREATMIAYPDPQIVKIKDSPFVRWFNQYLMVEKPLEYTIDNKRYEEEPWFNQKTIANIHIQKLDVFGTSIVDTTWTNSAALISFGNRVHIKTTDFVIKNSLLFKKGDPINVFLIQESERILRSRPYIKDARIYVIPNQASPDQVDILVLEKDIWSLGLGFHFPDIDEVDISLRESNLLGWGHELKNTLFIELDKPMEYELIYRVPSLGKTFTAAELIYSNRQEGELLEASLDRSFVTAATNLGAGLKYSRFNGVDDNYYSQEIFQDSILVQSMEGWLGWSIQLNETKRKKQQNLVLSVGAQKDTYFERPFVAVDSNFHYQNHTLYLTNLTFSQRDYFKSNYVFGYGRTEDVPIGTRIEFTGGYDHGELANRPYGAVSLAHGFRLKGLGYFSNQYSASTYIHEEAVEAPILKLESFYFSRLIGRKTRFRQRFFFNLNAIASRDQPENKTLDIRHYNGLRGLRSELLRGDSKLFFNATYAVFSPWRPLGFRFAFAANVDLGYISESWKALQKESPLWGFGLSIEANNENLIFGILQARISYFPDPPDDAGHFSLTAGVRRSLAFRDFAARAPAPVSFGDYINKN